MSDGPARAARLWVKSVYMGEMSLRDQHSDADQDDDRRSVLQSSFVTRYGQALRRRRHSRTSDRADDRNRLKAAFRVVSVILAAVFVWCAIDYAWRLIPVIRLFTSGTSAQGIVLRKQTDWNVSENAPGRYTVTYGFWPDEKGVIERQAVDGRTFGALNVDDPVTVVYVPSNPRISTIGSELAFPWPVAPIVSLVCCILSIFLGWVVIKMQDRIGGVLYSQSEWWR